MHLYEIYLSMRYNFRVFGTPPVPLIGTAEENLVFANLVIQGTLYGKDRFIRELSKRVGDKS